MIGTRKRWVLLGVTLAWVGVGSSWTQRAAEAKSASYTKTLDAYLKRCAHAGWSGSVLIADKGARVFEGGYGLAHRNESRKNDSKTLFEIASITKTFTACGVLKLAELKKLSLDDSIAKHLPGVPGDKQGVTVGQLLSHTSGVSRRSTGGSGTDLGAAVAAYLSAPLATSPGSTFGYWNGGYALLAGIIERVSGTSYEAFMHKHVLKPAGMKQSGFTGETLVAKRQAMGYDGETPVRLAAGHAYGYYGWNYKGMGGLVTSANDLLAFANAFANGKILSDATSKRMLTPVKQNYGLGWRITPTKRGDRRASHGGDVRAFHCQFDTWPSRKGCLIVLSNVNEAPSWRVSSDVLAIVEGKSIVEPSPPPIKIPKASLRKAVVGRYELPDDGGSIFVVARDRGLTLGSLGFDAAALLDSSQHAPDGKRKDAAKKAAAIFRAIIGGDPLALAPMVDPTVPATWARTLTDSIWRKQVKEHGSFASYGVLSAHVQGQNRVMVKLLIQHAKGRQLASMGLTHGKLSYLKFEDAGKGAHFGTSKRYVLAERDTWISYGWNPSDPPAPLLSFEGKKNAVETMLLTSPDGKATRLAKAADK